MHRLVEVSRPFLAQPKRPGPKANGVSSDSRGRDNAGCRYKRHVSIPWGIRVSPERTVFTLERVRPNV